MLNITINSQASKNSTVHVLKIQIKQIMLSFGIAEFRNPESQIDSSTKIQY